MIQKAQPVGIEVAWPVAGTAAPFGISGVRLVEHDPREVFTHGVLNSTRQRSFT